MKTLFVLNLWEFIKTINMIYIYNNICEECVMTSSVVSLFSHSHAIITTKIESQTVYYSAKTPHYNVDVVVL